VRTLYRELDLGPDASASEVSAAKSQTVRRLQAAKRQSLRDSYEVVPELATAFKRLELLRTSEAPPDAQALRNAEDAVSKLEAEALSGSPRFRALRAQADELERQVRALNQASLDKPAQRAAYDGDRPPLALLKLEECADPWFSDPRTCLFLLRVTIAEFLTAHGEEVFHPSDLTRREFSEDFSFNQILDGGP
jgi:hypothetical protein